MDNAPYHHSKSSANLPLALLPTKLLSPSPIGGRRRCQQNNKFNTVGKRGQYEHCKFHSGSLPSLYTAWLLALDLPTRGTRGSKV